MQETETKTPANEAPAAEKKAWVAPAATIEQVSEITKITGGGSGDGASCHT